MNEDKRKYRNVVLENILKMKQSTLKRHLETELCKTYDKVFSEDGFLYTEGTYPVLLVAHMDTVHKQTVKKIKYTGPVLSSPQGIGGDDRCGIYIILELIKKYKCSVVFTEDEEIGGIGACKFIASPHAKSCKVNYIMEFDRRGSNDAVFYSCDNPEFQEFIESTGYFKENFGTFSDISTIAPAIGVAAVNLSSGYYNEHTSYETINLTDVERAIEEAGRLINEKIINPYEYIEREIGHGSYFDDYYPENDYYSDYSYGDEFFLASKDEDHSKAIHHVYLTGGTCIEVHAINKMEALGIVIHNYPYLTGEDILTILS